MKMWTKLVPSFWFLIFLLGCDSAVGSHRNLQLVRRPKSIDNAIEITIDSNGQAALHGQLGMALPSAVGQVIDDCQAGDPAEECFRWGDFATLFVTSGDETNDYCGTVEWTSKFARRLEDCFVIEDGVHWYGGPGPTYYHTWPIEKNSRAEAPAVSQDVLGGYEYGGVSENYWLLSSGVAIHVDESVALHISMNSSQPDRICFIAEDKYPYKKRDELKLKYQFCTAQNGETFKDIHVKTLAKFYAKPNGIPDEEMMLKPFWSTWAEYRQDINQTKVLDLARRLVAEGFDDSSHIEIDDNWETCYGDLEFDPKKFPDPRAMTDELRSMNFNTTLWIQPMVNTGCKTFDEGHGQNFFVLDEKHRTGLTYTWVGNKTAAHVDFTNPESVSWFTDRVNRLKTEYGITSFKFDAGETSWLPYAAILEGPVENTPNIGTTKFVDVVSQFGTKIEVRVGRQTQNHPVFVRMLDKDSHFGYDNGLRSLIPSLFDFSIKGYPYVLPDMVGGNGYQGQPPTKEVYIRWVQVNAFMPAVQFSIVPWTFDQETVDIVKSLMALRKQYKDKILEAALQAEADGTPMCRPMWWVDPRDVNTLTIDDQYMLGDDILVAPVVTEGVTTRDIYLPVGTWTVGGDDGGQSFTGPLLVKDFPAPLLTLPYFIRST